MDQIYFTFINDNYCYDPLLLQYIIEYIVIPYNYGDIANSNGDYLLFINKIIMENIFNNLIKKYNLNLDYYNDFIIYLIKIHEISLSNNIYNDYGEIVKLLPTLPNNILYDFMFHIFRINPNIWKYMINPVTLKQYLLYNDIFNKKCDKIRYDNTINNKLFTPLIYLINYQVYMV